LNCDCEDTIYTDREEQRVVHVEYQWWVQLS